MKYSHIITIISAAGILLPVTPAAALSVPLPEIGAAITPAATKKKQGKKGKKKGTEKKQKNQPKSWPINFSTPRMS